MSPKTLKSSELTARLRKLLPFQAFTYSMLESELDHITSHVDGAFVTVGYEKRFGILKPFSRNFPQLAPCYHDLPAKFLNPIPRRLPSSILAFRSCPRK